MVSLAGSVNLAEDLEETLLPGWSTSTSRQVKRDEEKSNGRVKLPLGDSDYYDDRTTPTSTDNVTLVTIQKHKDSIFSRALRNTTIEPMLFLHILASNLISVLTANLYIDRVCRVTLNYAEDICQPYSRGSGAQKNSSIAAEIQVHVSTLMIYENFIEFAPIIIFALFLGSWCDRYGTKKPMIYATVGSLMYCLTLLTITFFPMLRPEFIWLAFVPLGLSGGSFALNVTAYSYISRITKAENRTFRIIVLQVCWLLGQPIGTLIGPKIFAYLNFIPVYIIASGIYALAVLYGIIFIRDDIPERSENSGNLSPFSLSGVKEMLSVVFKRRAGFLRRWAILLWIVSMLRSTILTSQVNLTYLFTRAQLEWDVQSYTQYQSINWFASCAGNFIMAHLVFKILQLSDPVVGFLSGIGYIATSLVFGFATEGWMMYFGSAINMLIGLQLPATRSLISKCVSSDEIAKAFSFLSLTEAIVQIPMGTLFNIFYNFTVDSFPGAFYFIQTFLYSIIALIFLYFVVTMRKDEMSRQSETKS